MEMETVMSYLANLEASRREFRAEEIAEALAADVTEELGHATAFAGRIKDLYGTPPGSMDFTAEQCYSPALGRPDRRRDRVSRWRLEGREAAARSKPSHAASNREGCRRGP